MGPGLVSLFLAAGVSTWIYTKFQRTTGNDTQRSATAAGIAGVVIFIVAFFILKVILPR